jgi:uncharacterized circularly permuted ATP-grasp superfamily protein/uncharacterized alpha-E superfamily protein
VPKLGGSEHRERDPSVRELQPDDVLSGSCPLCDDYRVATGARDEMCAGHGEVRPHWRYLTRALGDLGVDELQRRSQEARRLIRDNDVTYNIYDDPRGMGRPWLLDLMPMLIGSEEWRDIEAGLVQRAALLNLLLRDLYGPRSLVRKGLLPAELVYSHPGFLYPCVGMDQQVSRSLMFYAADLARTPDGQMWVLADRAQAPSGAGYALENRLVVSRVLPSLFRDSHVHRLATFFRTARAALAHQAPASAEQPNIVLLSAGPANETYFEHAYLASYLGYTLVQGSDLVVRNGKVWLTTLQGLRPVDVILRRMDDGYCDPVELREDSFLGVPGLVNAVRTGGVAVANPLGTGVLENPALMAFLPRLAQQLLGEDLRLPSVTTWWCGDPVQCSHVKANLEHLVIKTAHRGVGFRLVFGSRLTAAERAELVEHIHARPHLFVGQEVLDMSTVPVLSKQGLEARRTVLRSFLVADEQDYLAMPGGLTRVAADPDSLLVSSQSGALSKDTWVLATEPEKHVSLLGEARPEQSPYELDAELPGRVADNLYWVGRYAERAEFNSRLMRLTLQFLVTGENEFSGCLKRLLMTVTEQTCTHPGFVGSDAEQRLQEPEQELLSVIADRERTGSLAQTLSDLLLAARSLRDRLSSDTWSVVNDIDDELYSLQQIVPERLADALDELDNLVKALSAFSGLTLENMIRSRGWRFLDMGRRMERAVQTTRLLNSILVPGGGEDGGTVLMESLLLVVESMMSYRRRYRGGMHVAGILETVIGDALNPRSLLYQMSRLEEHVNDLPQEQEPGYRSELKRVALEAATMVRLADVRQLATPNPETLRRDTLAAFLGGLSQRLPALSDRLAQAYFQAAETPHQLIRLRARSQA